MDVGYGHGLTPAIRAGPALCIPGEMDKLLEERAIEPLGCMGGNFKAADLY